MTTPEEVQHRRWFAVIALYVGERKVKHTVGLPTGMTEPGSGGGEVEFNWPIVIVLQEDVLQEDLDTGHCTVIRLARNGEFAGDTWHETAEHAREQAEYEYGPTLGAWETIPAESDPAEFALAKARPS